jgi:hypothetical protein
MFIQFQRQQYIEQHSCDEQILLSSLELLAHSSKSHFQPPRNHIQFRRLSYVLNHHLFSFELTPLNSYCGPNLFQNSNFGGYGRQPLRLPICLPNRRLPNRAIIIQMARLSGLLVPGPFGSGTSHHRGGNTAGIPFHSTEHGVVGAVLGYECIRWTAPIPPR